MSECRIDVAYLGMDNMMSSIKIYALVHLAISGHSVSDFFRARRHLELSPITAICQKAFLRAQNQLAFAMHVWFEDLQSCHYVTLEVD